MGKQQGWASGFAGRLESALNACGRSQKDVAAAIGISAPLLSRYKTGETVPRADKVKRLAAECDVPYEWLAFNKGKGPGMMDGRDKALYGAVLTGAITEEEAALIRAYRQLKEPHKEAIETLANRLVEVEGQRPQAS